MRTNDLLEQILKEQRKVSELITILYVVAFVFLVCELFNLPFWVGVILCFIAAVLKYERK